MRQLLGFAATLLLIAGCGSEGGESAAAAPKTQFVSITTGSKTGTYYPVGGHVAAMVNDGSGAHGIKANATDSKGSVENVNLVLAGTHDFGMVQADVHYQAFNGLGKWDGQPQTELRSICSLYPEIITVVADAEIAAATDLAGKRVSIGSPGSGNRVNAELVLKTLGLDPASGIQAEALSSGEAPRMLQDNRIDAFFFTVGHPSGAITEATSGNRKVRFLDLSAVGDQLIKEFPYYTTQAIPAGMYPQAAGGDQAVPSFGMLTTFVTSSSVPDDVAYEVTKAVFENVERLQGLHKSLSNMTPAGMLSGLAAPLHPGAERYLREAGLLTQ